MKPANSSEHSFEVGWRHSANLYNSVGRVSFDDAAREYRAPTCHIEGGPCSVFLKNQSTDKLQSNFSSMGVCKCDVVPLDTMFASRLKINTESTRCEDAL